jgi:hypothetical protein
VPPHRLASTSTPRCPPPPPSSERRRSPLPAAAHKSGSSPCAADRLVRLGGCGKSLSAACTSRRCCASGTAAGRKKKPSTPTSVSTVRPCAEGNSRTRAHEEGHAARASASASASASAQRCAACTARKSITSDRSVSCVTSFLLAQPWGTKPKPLRPARRKSREDDRATRGIATPKHTGVPGRLPREIDDPKARVS